MAKSDKAKDKGKKQQVAAGAVAATMTPAGDGNLVDRSVTKVNAGFSPRGDMGQKYLAAGLGLGMRMWEAETPSEAKEPTRRSYETAGYVIAGRAELHLEGQLVLLEQGDSWIVPREALHTYKIIEPFTAVEATHPPAMAHNRDAPAGTDDDGKANGT